MVDLPLDKVLEVGYQNLRQNQQRFARPAAKIDPNARRRRFCTTSKKIIRQPTACCRLSAMCWEELRQFIVDHKIVTIPSSAPPIVEETPPFMRARLSRPWTRQGRTRRWPRKHSST